MPHSPPQKNTCALQVDDHDTTLARRNVWITAIFVAAIPRRRIIWNRHERLTFMSPLPLFFPLPDLFDDPGLQHRPLLSSLVAVTSSLSLSE